MKKRKKIKPWHKARLQVLVAASIVIFVVGFLPAKRLMLMKNVRYGIEAIRAAGYPTTTQELDHWKKSVPDEVNAAPLYLDALKTHISPVGEISQNKLMLLPEYGDFKFGPELLFDGNTRAAVLEYLKLNAQTLSKLHEATSFSESQYPTQYREGYGMWISELERMPQLVKLLCMEAAFAVHAEDSVQTEKSLIAALAFIRSVQGECDSWTFTLRADSIRIVLRFIAWALPQEIFDEPALIRLASDLDDQDDPESIRRAIIGDRAYTIVLVNRTSDSDHIASDVVGLWDQMAHTVLRGFTKTLAASELPRAEGIAACETIIDEMNKHAFYAILGNVIWVPSLVPFASLEARVRLGQSVMAVERYRLVYDQLPDTLGELVPEFIDELPIDPFDGNLIRYEVWDSGYKLYSVGRNLTDEHGDATRDMTVGVNSL